MTFNKGATSTKLGGGREPLNSGKKNGCLHKRMRFILSLHHLQKIINTLKTKIKTDLGQRGKLQDTDLAMLSGIGHKKAQPKGQKQTKGTTLHQT